ncbi:alkaline phosphatase family protein [Streptomyces sp. NPDC051576]|uniref:alkaline phosphatase family protein n=1 Tax=Streptomyces sp. NPDC051576 TaxID=3155803 RepID=UPI00342D831C
MKGRLDNWVSGVGSVRSLGNLDRADIPVHYAPADNYTVCDAYLSSTLSATGPNRTYLWSGKVESCSCDGGDESGPTWQTYAESLKNAGVTWKVYQNAADNHGDNGCAYFTNFANSDIAAAIKADVVAGTLPQVSWVVPNPAFSEHRRLLRPRPTTRPARGHGRRPAS